MRKIDLSETIKVLDSEEFKKASYREKMRVYEMLDEVRKNNARCDYYSYVKYVHGDMYKDTRHGKYICDTINDAVNKRQDMLDGKTPQKNQYIMLSVPPRTGKSMNVTETLPSYFLGRFKDERVILTAYGDDLVTDFSRKNRDKVDNFGKELFGIELDPNTRSVTDWNIKGTRGGSIARGIMAGITGKGCQLLVIDDPVKNQEEANSEVHRDRIWGEWLASLRTRVEPPAIVIVIMTRWHEDDLVGRLLNPEYGEPLPWKVVNLPLEAEENDPLGRKIGEPLWPEKYGYDFIRETKQYPSLFNSLYQGRPTSMEGNILKREWWQYYDILPQLQYKVISIDASFKDGEKNDFVSIQVWGKTGVNMYLCDNHTARMDFPTTLTAIRNMLKKHKDITCVLIEDKANGSALVSMLRKEVSGVIAVNPEGGKVARVNAIAPHIEAGNVFLPRQTIAPWVGGFVDECASFPKGKHDDQCLIAGTMITTLKGDRPIETIKAGERVITPYGIRKVKDSRMTGFSEVVTSQGITGTKNHPVFIKSGGFAPLGGLHQSNDLCDRLSLGGVITWKYKRLLSLMESNTGSWEGRESIISASQHPIKGGKMLKDFMWRSGKSIAERKYLKTMSFITKMVILLITTLATWSVYLANNILRSTLSKTWGNNANILKELDHLRQNGTQAKQGLNGIGNITQTVSAKFKQRHSRASSVVRTLNRSFIKQDFVPIIAAKNGDIGITLSTLPKYANTVVRSLKQNQQQDVPKGKALATEAVQPNLQGCLRRVYNLTIEKDHVYYANRVLVSNCDAMSQALNKLVFFYADIPHEVVLPGQFYSEEEKRDLGYTGRRIARPGKVVRRRIS